MSEVKLEEVFKNEAIDDFGDALRKAIRMREIQDYASLVELEYVESKEEFAEVIKKFLRRYHTHAKKLHLKIPKEESLDNIMGLVDRYGVKLVRASLISHALVKSSKEEESKEGEE
jgi:hypothetical protein